MIKVHQLITELEKHDQAAMVILADGFNLRYFEEIAVAKFDEKADIVVLRPVTQSNPVIPFVVIEKGWRPSA